VAKQQSTDGGRVFFTSEDSSLPLPNLIAHQEDSWRWFVEDGLSEIFSEINPIDDYTGQKLSLRFGAYRFDEPKTTDQFAKENNLTFEAPLHATVELTNKVTGEVKEQEIYLGDYPWMTERGTFIINGTERVVVSQLIRSAGVFFTADTVAGRNYYGAKMIPGRGAWLEFETAPNGTIYVKIDRRRKLPVTTLLRALGHPKTSEIRELFADIDTGETSYIQETLDKDTTRGANEALIEVYRRLRPGDLATVDNARQMIERMFFDFKRFDYSRVGRYKLNQRLGLDVANTAENRIFQMSDLVAIIREIIRLNNTQEPADDIDSLSNRRVKLVGELVARQFRVGMLRMQRNAMDRMSVADMEGVTPSQLINARPVVAAVREFFTSSQLSQLMDEVNPLSELSHKRRLSSMGPGGLSRERAGFDVRDAHPTHYGRICSVETPEGANVGLVLNLATYARVNEYGFIETPYLKVVNGRVTDDVVYLDAAQEAAEVIADAGAVLNEDGTLREVEIEPKNFAKGKDLLHKVGMIIRRAFQSQTTVERSKMYEYAVDYFLYLWCGPDSPLFDKAAMTTFERYFIKEKETHHEEKGFYFKFREREDIADMIMEEFGVNSATGHIINGHVPVHVNKGEKPIKANGKLMVIDGGFSEAYHKETGIAGYTLIYHSRGFELVQHEPFASEEDAITRGIDIVGTTQIVELNQRRLKVADMDKGTELKLQIEALEELLYAYRHGFLAESEKKNPPKM